MRLAPLALIALLLAGCAERWTRPGTTEAESDAMNAACANDAAQNVPVVLEWRMLEPPRIERDRECWERRDGQRVCRVFDRWRPARYGHVDVNAPARDGARRQCMVEKGFTFDGYRPLRLN